MLAYSALFVFPILRLYCKFTIGSSCVFQALSRELTLEIEIVNISIVVIIIVCFNIVVSIFPILLFYCCHYHKYYYTIS